LTSAAETVVLYADYTTRLSYYDDWLEAFNQSPRCRTFTHNICNTRAIAEVAPRVRNAELVVLLHSTNGDTTMYLKPWLPILKDRRGVLLSFVGNEVNIPGSPIAEKRSLFVEIEPDYIATQLLQEAGHYLFGDLARRAVLSVPHALNPVAFKSVRFHTDRRIDIGVRSVRYLAVLGDQDRNRIYDYFVAHAGELRLEVDIGTQRLNRYGWAEFLNDCRGTVSTEAGSWYLERDDHTVEAIRNWMRQRCRRSTLVIANDSPLRRLGHLLPWPVRAMLRKVLSMGPLRHESTVAEELPFEEVFDKFFRDYPRPLFYGKCISSRHFDAIGTKTVQIMFPGRFNDILEADRHYLALQSDFSNIDVVMERFHDDQERQRVVDEAYEHVCSGHTYEKRVANLLDAIDASKPMTNEPILEG
jgi:hypothetical protein